MSKCEFRAKVTIDGTGATEDEALGDLVANIRKVSGVVSSGDVVIRALATVEKLPEDWGEL